MLVTKRQYRGAEISAYNLSKELIAKGHCVIWVGLYSNSEKEVIVVEGAINLDLPNSSGWLSFKKIKKLHEIFKAYKPDICQANGSDTLRYLVALKLFGCKTRLVYRNISIISKWITNTPKYYLFQFLFSKTDKVVSVGKEAMDDFNRLFAFKEDKAVVIHRGVPLIQPNYIAVENIKRHYSITVDTFVFVHIGHFSAEKNHEFLIRAWKQLQQKHDHIKLVLLGDGLLREGILETIKQKGLSNSVIAPGLQTNIADWLSLSNVLLLCSTVEGVPGVIVEASFQGVPSIAVNVGGVKEVLIDGQNGLLVDHHDVDLFIEKCEQLINDTKLRNQLSIQSKSLVKDRFDSGINTARFIALYQSIL